ncbi:GSTT1 transferase, partial [Pseudoatta argentina]
MPVLYYFLLSPPCRAVMLVVEAIGLEMELVVLNTMDLTPEYEELNPQKTVPFLIDDDLKISESRAIMAYLVDQYGQDDTLYPRNIEARALVNQRLYFDLGNLYPNIFDCYLKVFKKEIDTCDPAQFEKLIENFQIMNNFLEEQAYVAGDNLTIADLSLVASVTTAMIFGFNLGEYNNISDWLERIQTSTPGYEKANGEPVEMFKQMIICIIVITLLIVLRISTDFKMPDLYQLAGSPPCRAVLLTAAALEVDLNLKKVDLATGEHLKPEFIKMNPQHTIPTLDDGGFYLYESRAIMIYLANQYGKKDSLYPKDPKKRALVDQRLFFDLGTLYKSFSDYYYSIMLTGAIPQKATYDKMNEALTFLNKFLEGENYVAGKTLTIADLALVVTVSNFKIMDYDLSKYSNILKWYSKIQAEAPKYNEIESVGMKVFANFAEPFKKKL